MLLDRLLRREPKIPPKMTNKRFRLPRIWLVGWTGIRFDWAPANVTRVSGALRGSIRFIGMNNRVEIGKGTSVTGQIVIRGNNNRLVIDRNCRINGKLVIKGQKQTMHIGADTTCQSVYLLSEERRNLTIGRGCMISRNVEIRTSDAHSLIDRTTGKRINLPADVVIGDHVWIGVGALLSKGSRIADDSVVGAKSFVNRAFTETGVVIAGVPATIVRRDVTWDRSCKPAFSLAEMNAWKTPAP